MFGRMYGTHSLKKVNSYLKHTNLGTEAPARPVHQFYRFVEAAAFIALATLSCPLPTAFWRAVLPSRSFNRGSAPCPEIESRLVVFVSPIKLNEILTQQHFDALLVAHVCGPVKRRGPAGTGHGVWVGPGRQEHRDDFRVPCPRRVV